MVGVASVLKMAVMLYCDCDVPVSTVSANLSNKINEKYLIYQIKKMVA